MKYILERREAACSSSWMWSTACACTLSIVSAASLRTVFTDNVDFAKWYGERVDAADLVLDSAVPSRNVTFVTCSYNRFKNERTLVFASE